jgi:crotonobetainyl-CoA:carnitine CoA-transferase CaiB-like acyl-CoA transferase
MLGQALTGLTVLDFSQGIAGPHCACLLADFGARVIKVEPPEGDWSRGVSARLGESSVAFLTLNRGKEGIVLDLKEPASREAALRLARGADILIESNRPGVMERLGLGPAQLCAQHPGLIYLSISGFGQRGPQATRPGTDAVLQAMTGLSFGASGTGEPIRVRVPLIDLVTGVYASQAVLAALIQRARSGKGLHLDVSLLHASLALQSYKVAEHRVNGGATGQEAYATVGIYRTQDGYIALSGAKPRHTEALLNVIGRLDLLKDPRFSTEADRFENQEALRAAISAELAGRTTQDWLAAMGSIDLLCQEVLPYDRVLADTQVMAERLFAPAADGFASVRAPGLHWAEMNMRPAPALGADTLRVLREMA